MCIFILYMYKFIQLIFFLYRVLTNTICISLEYGFSFPCELCEHLFRSLLNICIYSFKIFFSLLFYVYGSSAYMYVCTPPCVHAGNGDNKKKLVSMELELKMVANCHINMVNEIWNLWKSISAKQQAFSPAILCIIFRKLSSKAIGLLFNKLVILSLNLMHFLFIWGINYPSDVVNFALWNSYFVILAPNGAVFSENVYMVVKVKWGYATSISITMFDIFIRLNSLLNFYPSGTLLLRKKQTRFQVSEINQIH